MNAQRLGDEVPRTPDSTTNSYPRWMALAIQPVQEWYSKWSLNETIEVDAAESPSFNESPATANSAFLPVESWQALTQSDYWLKTRYDLRDYGVDLIVDLGWGRGDDVPIGT